MNCALILGYCSLNCWWMTIATVGKKLLDSKPWPFFGMFILDMGYDSNELLQSFCTFIDKLLTLYPCQIQVILWFNIRFFYLSYVYQWNIVY